MKQGIHPKYGVTSVRCACGNVIETKSTREGVIQVEVCSACHPFFTGKQKLMDTAGRIDRFKKKFGDKMVLGNQKKQKPAPQPVVEKKSAKGGSAAQSGGKEIVEAEG